MEHSLADSWPLRDSVYWHCCVSGGDLTRGDSCNNHLRVKDTVQQEGEQVLLAAFLLRDTRPSNKWQSLYHVVFGLFSIKLWNRFPWSRFQVLVIRVTDPPEILEKSAERHVSFTPLQIPFPRITWPKSGWKKGRPEMISFFLICFWLSGELDVMTSMTTPLLVASCLLGA